MSSRHLTARTDKEVKSLGILRTSASGDPCGSAKTVRSREPDAVFPPCWGTSLSLSLRCDFHTKEDGAACLVCLPRYPS